MKDPIERQEAIDWLTNEWDGMVTSVFDGIKNLPSADPERKRGRWIRNDNGTYSCSLCQSWIPEEQRFYARFCLCCGARMEEGNLRLIDADALIERLEKNICEPCKERKEDYDGVRCRACQYGDEIDDIEDAPTVMGWIPCSERLPEPNQTVLVSIKGKVDADWIAVDSTGYGSWYRCMKDVMSVVAWMPLPEPYKEEEE